MNSELGMRKVEGRLSEHRAEAPEFGIWNAEGGIRSVGFYWVLDSSDLGFIRFWIWDCGFWILIRKTSYFIPLPYALCLEPGAVHHEMSSIQRTVLSIETGKYD